MASFDEMSHGRRRPRASIRRDRMPKSPAAELAAPYRDPSNGRFGAGNPGGRLRQVAALARVTAESLLRLESADVAPWLRGALLDGQKHVQGLIDALPVATEELTAIAADLARARLLAAACLSQGCREDTDPDAASKWRDESMKWTREARSLALTLRALSRDTQKPGNGKPPSWLLDMGTKGAK